MAMTLKYCKKKDCSKLENFEKVVQINLSSKIKAHQANNGQTKDEILAKHDHGRVKV